VTESDASVIEAPSAALEVAIESVRQAAAVCRAVRLSFRPELAASKADQSPVTVADYASQALISLALAEAFPADPIIGEESSVGLRAGAGSPLAGSVLDAVRTVRPEVGLDEICTALDRCNDAGGPNGRRWTVDPVDGTKGFLRNQQYAVALALIEDGLVTVGVLGCPNLPETFAREDSELENGAGCLFVAERGRGAWQLPLAGDSWADARRISVSEATDFGGARFTESYESGHSSRDAGAGVADELGITAPPLRMDSQAKYAVVGRGDAELYFRLPSGGYVEQIWDHAAGSLVVEEAGGRVSDIHGNPLDFTRGRRLESNRGLIVAPVALHQRALAAAARVLGA
jgi:HAL2 family 3'(2'),5'-bisphosphate nucleotidase